MYWRDLIVSLRSVSVKALLFFFVIAPTFLSAVPAKRSTPRGAQSGQNPAPLNLNGRWKSEGQEYIVAHRRESVRATFISSGACPRGGTRSYFMEGQLQGTKLSGTLVLCTTNKKLLDECNLEEPYVVKFDATVSQNSITGSFRHDYVNFDTRGGRWVNCRVRIGGGSQANFSLTRVCETDKQKQCSALAAASQTIANARRATAPRTSNYAALKQNLSGQLSQIRNELCDDPAAQEQIDELMNTLESIDDASGQSWKLVLIENGLKNLSNESCKATNCENYSGEITCDCDFDGKDETSRKFESCGPPSNQPKSFRSRCEDWVRSVGYRYETDPGILQEARDYLESLEESCPAVKCAREYNDCVAQAQDNFNKCRLNAFIRSRRGCLSDQIAAQQKCRQMRIKCQRETPFRKSGPSPSPQPLPTPTP